MAVQSQIDSVIFVIDLVIPYIENFFHYNLLIFLILKTKRNEISFDFEDWDYGVYHHFQHYFSYIVTTISFIGGGNRSTRRKPPTNFINRKKVMVHNRIKQNNTNYSNKLRNAKTAVDGNLGPGLRHVQKCGYLKFIITIIIYKTH